MVGSVAGAVPEARRVSLRALRGADGRLLDRGLVVFWPAPRSYTGEDCAELHVHGGPAVLEAVSAALLEAGARPAEPGEFTRRAFLNGRMDLLEAEGVADLVAAETEAQRLLALRQLDGAQSAMVGAWAERLRRLLAWQEALIDFPDEDLPADVETGLSKELLALEQALREAAGDAERGARLREGVAIAITGAPNVGKSSLMNALCGRDVSMISPLAGTTRDALESWVQIAGVAVTLIDTAGLRDTEDALEAEGVRRAGGRAAGADLVLHVAEAGTAAPPPQGPRLLAVANKMDLAVPAPGWLGVSALSGQGMAALRAALADSVRCLTATSGSAPLSRARHRAALIEAASCLSRALSQTVPELRGEELRLAMRGLGRITGAVGVEDVLTTIFDAFCIGK